MTRIRKSSFAWLAVALFGSDTVYALPGSVIRLSDQLAQAQVQTAPVAQDAAAAEEMVWRAFPEAATGGWQILRGRLSSHNGELLVQSESATPVILSPKRQPIDWRLYRAVEIEMAASGGNEAKVKIADLILSRPLASPGKYQTYRFDVDIDAPKGSRPLAIMPTDSLSASVSIRSIKLISKSAGFTKRVDKAFVGKQDEFRSVIYLQSPSVLSFSLTVPAHGHLHVGYGIMSRERPLTFQISVEGASTNLYSKLCADPNRWEDADVDLSAWSGKSIKLRFATRADRSAIALWTNPTVVSQPAGNSPPQPVNVLIYMIDTLRADHASVYNYPRNTTPFLKTLGDRGVVFDDCQAQATWTKSSVASLMTSLYAFTHGIAGDADTIPLGATTLAEQLRMAGYTTASITGSPYTGRATGLERGFDYLYESSFVLANRIPARDKDTDSTAVNKVAFDWLDTHATEPFFLYLHSTDPHAPYNPPPPFDSAFANRIDSSQFQRDYLKFNPEKGYGGGAVFNADMASKAGINPSQFIRKAIDRYDGEILHNDASLEALIARLKRLKILDQTLIIVLSDHGEEFLDHGWTAHGHSVYQELTHCVFVMSCPKLFPAPRHIDEPVQLIDVMPTILDALSLKRPQILQGESLVPLALGRHFERSGLVVASRFAAPNPIGLIPEAQVDSFAILDSKWKFIYRNKAAKVGINKVELYDRSVDRIEAHDVSKAHQKEIDEMIGTLSQWIQGQNKVRSLVGHKEKTVLDQHTINQLRSLGYLGGKSN